VSRPYRHPSDIPQDPPDPEVLAMTEYARRSRRVVRAVVLASCAAAAALAPVFYITAQEIQFAISGVAFLRLNAMAAALPLFLALGGIRPVANAIMGRLGPRWVHELATRHGIDVEQVRELTAHL
jgi:hypothetical protein